MSKTLKEKLPVFLTKITKNTEESLKENEWVAGKSLTYADTVLFTWMSIFVYNKNFVASKE